MKNFFLYIWSLISGKPVFKGSSINLGEENIPVNKKDSNKYLKKLEDQAK